jgi:hypothetical protein
MRGVPAVLSLALLAAAGPASEANKDEARGQKVAFAVHSGYFEKNNAGLKGESSHLALAGKKEFDKVFGVAFVVGAKQNFLPPGAFDTKLVAAVIKRGPDLWTYTVEKVAEDKGTLYVQYKATKRRGGKGTARYASPLILSVGRDRLTRVLFIENGQKAGTAEVKK